MARLILLIGVPGSGKSWLAARMQHCPGYRLVSTDAIRAQLFGDEAVQGAWSLVWREVQRQLRQAAIDSVYTRLDTAIYDATNARRRDRRTVIRFARRAGFTNLTGLWVDTPLWLCLQRNQQRSRQVPEPVIQRMYRQLLAAPPSLSEGLDRVIRYAGSANLGDDRVRAAGTEIAPFS